MQIAVFSARPYDRRFLDEANQRDAAGQGFAFVYFDAALDVHTAALAQDCAVVCVFVNDRLDAPVLHALHTLGRTRRTAALCRFNNVDLAAAKALDLFVARVPAYSPPKPVGRHALALVMTLNRQTHRAYNRVREGTSCSMACSAHPAWAHGRHRRHRQDRPGHRAHLQGMGCTVLGHDPYPSPAFAGVGDRVGLDELLARADIVSLHCPLTPDTQHLINDASLARNEDRRDAGQHVTRRACGPTR